jgi:hypothetical protein
MQVAMYTDVPHVADWIRQHGAVLADREICAGFESFLTSFPWDPSRLSWGQIDHLVYLMTDSWEDEIVFAAQAAPIGGHEYLLIMYSGSEPGIFCRIGDGLRDIDLLYAQAAGPRYFCGADMSNGQLQPTYEDFAEFDGFSKVIFHIK